MDDIFHDIELKVQRIEQLNDHFCGVACGAMLFNFFNFTVDQEQLYNLVRANMKEPNNWATDPSSLSFCINSETFAPDPIEKEIEARSESDFQSLINIIYSNLQILGIPSLALIRRGAHWVIVDGIRCQEDQNGNRSAIGLFITDPFRTAPERKFVPIDVAMDEYFTPIRFGTFWKGKYVTLSTVGSSADSIRIGESPNVGGAGLVGHELDSAIQRLQTLGFVTPAKLIVDMRANAIEARESGLEVRYPMKVYDLDSGQLDFWIHSVPIEAQEGQILSSEVAVEDGTGRVLELGLEMQHSAHLDIDSITSKIKHELGNIEDIVIDPHLYWKSSIEIRSRFDCFRKLTISGEKFFALRNGDIVGELTDPQIGGQ